MKVLIVDDSASGRSILRHTFQAHGCRIIEARNGREGLALAAEHRPDLIVSDALMPVLDGFGFLRELKADATLSGIPFIFYSAVYTGRDEEKLARSLGAEAFFAKPLEPEILWREVQTLLSGHVSGAVNITTATLHGEEQYLREYNHVVVAKLEEKVKELENLVVRMVQVLVNLLDAKSPWTMGHSERVAGYAVRIAQAMGFDENRCNLVNLGAMLHDIGKIGTYDTLLDKPSRLTEEEYAVVKRHPDRGADALAMIAQLKEVIPLIRHHHENFDGTGYPRHLERDAIPLAAKIIRVADSFDSMTASRPYRAAPGLDYAVAELTRCAGRQFDSAVVKVFLKILEVEGAAR